jgi:hypothetical protein
MSVTPDHNKNAINPIREEAANGALVGAGVTRVDLYTDEDGF